MAATDRRSVAAEVGLFVLAGAVALALVGVATSIAARRVGEREAIANVRTSTVIVAQGVVAPAIEDGLVDGDPAAVARLDDIVRQAVLDPDLVRVKVWTADGTVVYSDEPALIGTTFGLDAEELDAMATGRIEAEVSDLSQPENELERPYGTLLEVYLPIRTPSGDVLLFEAYHRYGLVAASGDRLWREFAPITIGALIALEVVQLPLALSLARRLRQRQLEREGLLQRAIDASEVERRQIASDLHDGVVQDLAGVAFGLSAAARRRDGDAAEVDLLDGSADTIRASIRALRSLVVDIYPPDFDEVSLGSALDDLAVRVRERGIDVDVDTAGLVDPPADHAARLLYRAAQEGVRNVLAHAAATRVGLVVRSDAGETCLEVHDDGAGFDAATAAERAADGHVGLVVLRGLVSDAGGSMAIDSTPGGGTILRVAVPTG